MTLPLTPDMMEAAYNYLKATPPFCRLKLPDSDEVVFNVAASSSRMGWYQWDGERHTITASVKSIGHTTTLMQVMAHEAIHLYLEMTGQESRSGNCDTHNAAFKKLAARVCKVHGFDPNAFY